MATILAQTVHDWDANGVSRTITGFAVPVGTECLVVNLLARCRDDNAATVSSVTHNALALTQSTHNFAAGYDYLNTWAGYRRTPSVGTFDIVITTSFTVRGGVVHILALSNVKASGDPIGGKVMQRVSSGATTTVGLGLTPAASGDSLLITTLAMAQAGATLSSFTGTGFTEVATDAYAVDAKVRATIRYRLNAPASANTVSAVFSASNDNIGGSLIEILSEPAGGFTDVSGGWTTTQTVTGSVADTDTARIADASYRNGDTAWTEAVSLQPDVAGANRRIISAGPAGAPNLTVDQVATGTVVSNVYRCQYRLSDGQVTIESGAGTQATAAHVLTMVHAPGNPTLYLNGQVSESSTTNGNLVGELDIGTGGLAIGGHDGTTPAAYTGSAGRYIVYQGAWTPEQTKLFALSQTDPDSIWGYGEEDLATDANASPVAMPLNVELTGQPSAILTPEIVDPAGGALEIISVTQPANGTLAIAGDTQLQYTPTPGWQGTASATYTVSDGTKDSTARISFRQTRPSLRVTGDSVTVNAGATLIFDPRSNDVGAGTLRVVSVSAGTLGTTSITTDGRIRYVANP